MHRLAVEVAGTDKGPLGVDAGAEHARQYEGAVERERERERRLEVLELLL